jgi:hypothetical protein
MSAKANRELVLVEQIEPRILTLRARRVILDADLAELYGTTTKAFNQAVKRNQERFPGDFMFRLTAEEVAEVRSQATPANMRSQTVTSSPKSHGGRRYLPYAFTEHGAIMAASVLNTPRAIDVSVYVVRAFVKLREFVAAHRELAGKLAELESRVAGHDEAIASLVAAIRRLLEPPAQPPRRQIGFHAATEGE